MTEGVESAGRPKILAVDDQPNNLVAIEAMLGDMNTQIVIARSGFEALRCLLESEFAVILLDVMMPEMDGYETARLIREREKSRQTPIIFLTAFGQTESNVFKGYSLGAVDFLFKPIVPEVLRSKVQFFVNWYRSNAALRGKTIELERLSRQNELILNSAADGLVGIALDGTVTFANPSACNMTGRGARSFVGKPAHEVLHPVMAGRITCDRDRCPVRAALFGRSNYELRDDTFWRADGTSFPAEYSVSPMKNEDGDVFGSVLTFRDVTERRAAGLAMENERLYREAQRASSAKDDFLATLSHELRTPMTSIIGWLDILAIPDLEESVRIEAMEAIRASSRHQAQLIEDMLDVSRIILGKFRLDLQPTNLPEVMREIVENLRPIAVQKGLNFDSDIQCDGVVVSGDSFRLRQAIWNLISNAIKFTDPGGRLSIESHCINSQVEIMVRDNGIGIEPEALPHIFDRLRQGEAGKKQGGLGIGLAIVYYIVQGHGGRVEAHSDGPGKGSTFRILLPAWRGETGQEQLSAGTQSASTPV